LRAIRFALLLNFRLEHKTKTAIFMNWEQINKLTAPKINSEILKLPTKDLREKFKKIIKEKKRLTML
jgi:tRNA nucleotidyltransferase/poly(A) polymerase